MKITVTQQDVKGKFFLVGNPTGETFAKEKLAAISSVEDIEFEFDKKIRGINSSYIEGIIKYLIEEKGWKRSQCIEKIHMSGSDEFNEEVKEEWEEL